MTHVVDPGQCQNAWPVYALTSGQLCAYARYGVGACQGDSGGPPVADDRLTGIISIERPCAVGAPDLLTDVAHHRTWIRATAASDELVRRHPAS